MRCDEARSAAAVRHPPYRDGGSARAAAPRLHPRRVQRPILVEFLGIAGSGKTTLCSALASELRRDGFSVIARDDYFAWMGKPWYKRALSLVTNGLHTWRFVFSVYRFLYFTARLRGRALMKTGSHLTYMHVWLAKTARRTAPCCILLDQFAWHRLANQLMHRPVTSLAERALIRTVTLFYPERCDPIWIHKTTPVDLAVQRISGREMREGRAPWFIEKLPPERKHVLLTRQAHLYELICDAIRSRHGDSVHCVDGARPIPEQVCHAKSTLIASFERGTPDTSLLGTSRIHAEPQGAVP